MLINVKLESVYRNLNAFKHAELTHSLHAQHNSNFTQFIYTHNRPVMAGFSLFQNLHLNQIADVTLDMGVMLFQNAVVMLSSSGDTIPRVFGLPKHLRKFKQLRHIGR